MKINKAVEAALKAIELCKRRIVMFEFVIQSTRRDTDPIYENAIQIINGKLHQKLNEAYQTLFMWDTIVPEKVSKEAKKAAFDYFLKESASIMKYLDINLSNPENWLASDEDEFREEIERYKDE